ncbi:MAG: ferredoxin reductase family protein [Granulosicoccaceae bacterium]
MPKFALSLFAALFFLAHWLILPDLPLTRKIPAFMAAFAMSAMSMAFILAVRWPIVERLSGGLDKSYRLHRWFGLTALIGIVGHWLLVPGGAGQALFPMLAGLGEELGEVSLYALLILIALSAIQVLPYRWWRYSHYAMGPVFAVAVMHTFLSDIPLALGSLAWNCMLAVSTLGLIAWIWKFVRDTRYKPSYHVSSVRTLPGTTEITLEPISLPIRHRAGQFAFVSFDLDGLREPHPFTIASADAGGELRFAIKALGDFTEELQRSSLLSCTARVEGPYGRFSYRRGPKKQVWVAGGIGITPFLAFLQELAPDHPYTVDLVYCVRSQHTALYLDELTEQSKRLQHVKLHVLASDEGNRLNPSWAEASLQTGWHSAGFWFCGPESLRGGVEELMREFAISPRKLKYEYFDMRGAVRVSASDLYRQGRRFLQEIKQRLVKW